MNSTLTNSTTHLENGWNFSFLNILILSFHAFSFTFSLPLNAYIIVFLFPGRGVMGASDVFSLNQAFAEIFFVLFGPFHSLCVLQLCFYQPLGFFLGVSVNARCLFQCSVCIERYLAVVHPMTFLRFKPLRYRFVYSIMVWIMSLAVGITCACTFPRMPYKVFSAMYIFVLTADVFCGVSILKKLKRPGPRDLESNTGEMNAAKRKAFYIVSVNLLVFLVQNIPTCVTFGIEKSLAEYTFRTTIAVNLLINLVTGSLQQIGVLRRAGKRSSVCCSSGTPA